MKAVVPAAGLGTRMLPATKAVPKPLLPVVDRPTIGYVVDEALEAGADSVVLVLGPADEAILDHLGRDEDLEAALRARGKEEALEAVRAEAHPDAVEVVRQPEPRGLGDAVLRARPEIDEPFLVLCADDVIPTAPTASEQLVAAYEDLETSVFSVRQLPMEAIARYGAVDAEPVAGREGVWQARDLVEKPDPAEAPSRLSTMGRYLFTPGIFDHLEATEPVDGELELTDAMARMARGGEEPIHAVAFEGKRYDVGTPLGFLEANVALALARDDLGDEARALLDEFL